MNTMQGKTVVITGGNSGIGSAAAAKLMAMGANVVITSRNLEKGQRAADLIRSKNGSSTGNIQVVQLDLASFRSVQSCATALGEQVDAIDVLLNNAGLILSQREVTEDGLEMTFGVNHVGHFLLTHRLKPLLLRGNHPRVVHVSSRAHTRVKGLNFEDLQTVHRYDGWKVYCLSKLANIYFSSELARRWKADGITSHSLHPGVIATGFSGDGDTRGLFRWAMQLARPFMITPEKGAQTSIYLASAATLPQASGGYYASSKLKKPSKAGQDQAAAAKLWDLTFNMVSDSLE